MESRRNDRPRRPPGQGKTALALTFARHALDQRYDEATDAWKKPGHAVGMFSLEMTNEQLMLRLLASYGSESLGRIRSGELDEHAMQKLRMVAGDMREWPLYLDDSSFLTINQLRGKARRMKDRYGIEMLVIDYLQLLRSESAQAKDNRQNEVAEISRGIKALGQGTRNPHHHPRPVESPFRGSQVRARAPQPARIGRH